MLKVGIDAIGFYTPRYCLDLATLAEKRNIDVSKLYTGLGQKKMAIPAPGEDIVTMAANAAEHILTAEDLPQIDTLILATECSIDYSKAASIYVHKLLNLQPQCRSMEIKQACYGATAALQMALAALRQNPSKKILIIASDIAYYGFNTTGESSQGAGAIAMLLSANPRLLSIDPESGICTEDVMDFWRPNYCTVPIVDGKYSCDVYMRVLEKTWQQYGELSGRAFLDHDYFCYHVSVPKLVVTTHKRMLRAHAPEDYDKTNSLTDLKYALNYCRETGNCYTAALYISLLSLLETTDKNLANARIGLYSYGSGCVGEYFSGVVPTGYKKALFAQYHQELLKNRTELTYAEYEKFYSFQLPTDGSSFVVPEHNTGKFRLAAIEQHKRIYEKV